MHRTLVSSCVFALITACATLGDAPEAGNDPSEKRVQPESVTADRVYELISRAALYQGTSVEVRIVERQGLGAADLYTPLENLLGQAPSQRIEATPVILEQGGNNRWLLALDVRDVPVDLLPDQQGLLSMHETLAGNGLDAIGGATLLDLELLAVSVDLGWGPQVHTAISATFSTVDGPAFFLLDPILAGPTAMLGSSPSLFDRLDDVVCLETSICEEVIPPGGPVVHDEDGLVTLTIDWLLTSTSEERGCTCTPGSTKWTGTKKEDKGYEDHGPRNPTGLDSHHWLKGTAKGTCSVSANCDNTATIAFEAKADCDQKTAGGSIADTTWHHEVTLALHAAEPVTKNCQPVLNSASASAAVEKKASGLYSIAVFAFKSVNWVTKAIGFATDPDDDSNLEQLGISDAIHCGAP